MQGARQESTGLQVTNSGSVDGLRMTWQYYCIYIEEDFGSILPLWGFCHVGYLTGRLSICTLPVSVSNSAFLIYMLLIDVT